MEQRIINPDLVDTDVGKRDIRAIPGPLTPAPKGGYSSSLEFEGNTFTATYVFHDRGQRRRSPPTPTSVSAPCRGRTRTPTATVRA